MLIVIANWENCQTLIREKMLDTVIDDMATNNYIFKNRRKALNYGNVLPCQPCLYFFTITQT